jgi:predicted house-cleaning noncanonical NTP pyrophosphatase (MazG superfamily)
VKRGYIKLWRKSKESTVFAHEGLWKLWCLCLMKANHEGAEVMITGLLNPIKLNPGQFITGRNSLHSDYHQGHLKKKYRRKPAPSVITVYRWLSQLENMQLLNIKTYNKYSIITIINWYQYQTDEQQMNNRRTSNEHKQELKEELKEETPNFFSLKNRYSDPDLIEKVFQAIASTRKSNKVAESVLFAQLQKWERYPVEQVEAGIRIYLDKDCAGQGKREEYLLGIIRNQPGAEPNSQQSLISPKQQPSIEELLSND